MVEENAKLEAFYNEAVEQATREGEGHDAVRLLKQTNHRLELQVVELMNNENVFIYSKTTNTIKSVCL